MDKERLADLLTDGAPAESGAPGPARGFPGKSLGKSAINGVMLGLLNDFLCVRQICIFDISFFKILIMEVIGYYNIL